MLKKSVQRVKEIITVLGFYGFGYIVDSKFKKEPNSPENLKKAFIELGPTFIKIGQILSTRPDLIPRPYADELTKLQDKVPPEKFEDISELFFKEFTKSIEDTFLYFNKIPIACASIAQAHKAKLKNGTDVIVKIQRPEIYEKMKLDLNILSKLAKLTKTKFLDSIIDLKEAVDELITATELELDFNNEAKNIKLFKKFSEDLSFVSCPFVVDEFCTTKVLTMEFIDGFKINDLKRLKKGGYDLDDLGEKLAFSYFKQIFEDGFFHGDPHPGNIFVHQGKICYLDFGIMGHLSPSLMAALNEVLIAIAYDDINKLISVFMSIGIKTGSVDRNQLYEDLDYLFENYLSTALSNIQVSVLFQEIFDIAKRNNIKLPTNLTLLIRGLVIIEGVIVKISPNIKLIDVAIPYVKSNNSFNILKDFDLNEFFMHTLKFTKDTTKIPRKFLELSDSLISGRIKVQLNHTNLENPLIELHKMVNRIVLAVILSSLIIGSSLIIRSNVGPKIFSVSILGVPGFVLAAIMSLWILVSIIRSGKM